MNEADSRPSEKVCDVSDCNAWKEGDYQYCHHHKGLEEGQAGENNDRAVKHGLHTSAETFFENADEHHLDTYYAMHEALCSRYERIHGWIDAGIKKDLAEVAFEMAKLDMAKEYEAENAVDTSKPITEMETQMSESGPWEKEVISKVEKIKTHIRRENRLTLKDMGIYESPEKQKANAMEKTLAEVLSE